MTTMAQREVQSGRLVCSQHTGLEEYHVQSPKMLFVVGVSNCLVHNKNI